MRINIPEEFIEADAEEIFLMLCRKLHMNPVLDEDGKYEVKPDGHCNKVWKDGEIVDYRGDLFIALRNVAVQLYPNLLFRNDDYIYNK